LRAARAKARKKSVKDYKIITYHIVIRLKNKQRNSHNARTVLNQDHLLNNYSADSTIHQDLSPLSLRSSAIDPTCWLQHHAR
jgi:hypothetical protein